VPLPSLDLADAAAAAAAGVAAGGRLSRVEMRRLVEAVLTGGLDSPAAEEAFGRLLVALAERGEAATEIAGAAEALRARMRPLSARGIVADTCGTGGDGSGSFNISTAAAIVAAAAGVPVAKHGNRSVTSRTGSADVLEALGVRIDLDAASVAACLEETGLAFCHAPHHHPTMARVAAIRRAVGRPTVFNLVGPLCNPAGASVQVIGVGRPALREPLAAAAALLGLPRAVVVTGGLGDSGKCLDELSLFGPTEVVDVSPAGIVRHRWTPEDFGLPRRPTEEIAQLAVDGPQQSAAAIRRVFAGETGPSRDVVVLNAAAVLLAAGRADDPPSAARLAAEAIDTAAAARKLEQLALRSQVG